MVEQKKQPQVQLYTDGSCLGNPGPGGWAVLLRFRQKDQVHEKLLEGCESDTTNNRMELMAALKGLSALKKPCRVTLYTDSQYVKKGMTEWITNWVANGWKNAKKKPVANADLWQLLLEAVEPHHLQWRWVKAHDGHPENERVDEAARNAAQTLLDAEI